MPAIPAAVLQIDEVRAAARILGLDLDVLEIRQAEDIAPTFPVLNGGAEALHLCTDPIAEHQPNTKHHHLCACCTAADE